MLVNCTLELIIDLLTMLERDLKAKYKHISTIIEKIYVMQVHARFVTEIGA
jgi:hypothetical protein